MSCCAVPNQYIPAMTFRRSVSQVLSLGLRHALAECRPCCAPPWQSAACEPQVPSQASPNVWQCKAFTL